MKHIFLILLLALSAVAQSAAPPAGKIFDQLADSALMAMTKRAEGLKIKGAAVVAYIEGETTKSWSSKMVVVGAMKNARPRRIEFRVRPVLTAPPIRRR